MKNLYFIDFGGAAGGEYVRSDGFFVSYDGSLILWKGADRESIKAINRNKWASIEIVDEEGTEI